MKSQDNLVHLMHLLLTTKAESQVIHTQHAKINFKDKIDITTDIISSTWSVQTFQAHGL